MTTYSNEFGKQEPEPEDPKAMSLMGHLGELRQRVVKSAIAVIIFFVIAMTFSEMIIEFLKQPLVDVLPEGSNALHFTGPLDVFTTSIKISFLAAMVAGCPV